MVIDSSSADPPRASWRVQTPGMRLLTGVAALMLLLSSGCAIATSDAPVGGTAETRVPLRLWGSLASDPSAGSGEALATRLVDDVGVPDVSAVPPIGASEVAFAQPDDSSSINAATPVSSLIPGV